MKKLRAYYIIPDQQMLRPNSGPAEHIKIGIKYLSRNFEIESFAPGKEYVQTADNEAKSSKAHIIKYAKNGLIGILRDLKALVKNHRYFLSYYKTLKSQRPDFVFERAEYLNYNGLIASKFLRIPHFYEVNWVFFRGVRQFYHSWFNPIAKRLEEWAYNSSTHCFFIGNQNKFLKLKNQNWEIIQNGIPLAAMQNHESRIHKMEDKIHCCVVAKLMPHHRFDILTEALKKISDPSALHFHFIGYEFDEALKEVPENIAYTFHGSVHRDELTDQMAEYHIGVISGGPHYSSFMKLYQYAAVKLMVICPELENLVNTFEEDEILFFRNEDADALAQKLNQVIENKSLIAAYGQSIYDRVKKDFTWDTIFDNISERIVGYLDVNQPNTRVEKEKAEKILEEKE